MAIVLLVSSQAYSQSQYTDSLFQAYIKSDMKQWKRVIDQMQAHSFNQNQVEFTAELVNYQYGYVAWHIGNDLEDEAEKYLDLAIENLEWLEENNFDEASTLAYWAAFYGFRIGINTWYVTLYGYKCNSSAEKAVEIDSANPFCHIQMANLRYYQPPILGGSLQEAIDYYLKAESIYLTRPIKDRNRDWIYLNLLATIASFYTEFKDYPKAKVYYEKLLNIQPNYDWVKLKMLPDLIEKMNAVE